MGFFLARIRKISKYLSVAFLCLSGGAAAQTPQAYQAYLPSSPPFGAFTVNGVVTVSPACPEFGIVSSTFSGVSAPALLAESIFQWDSYLAFNDYPFIKYPDGTWQPNSFVFTSSNVMITSPGSIFQLNISSAGIITTKYTSPNPYLVSQTETIDLNTGAYTYHRFQVQTYPALVGFPVGCPAYTASLTEDIRGTMTNIELYPIAPPNTARLILTNPEALGSVLPLSADVPARAASTAPLAFALAADGASAAVIVYESSSPNPVALSLTGPGGTNDGIGSITAYSPEFLTSFSVASETTYQDPAPINLQDCTANAGPGAINPPCIFLDLLWAPNSMPQNAYNGGVTVPFELTVTAHQTGAVPPVSQNSIPLEPPPLVLVHGLWSNAPAAWSSFQQWLVTNYPHNLVFTSDYGPFSSLTFENLSTQQTLATAITNAIKTAVANGVVAHKVDIVAHSMGGLVTRFFMDNGAPVPFSPGFLPSPPIHQLITVGTPQNGSPFASFLEQNQNNALVPGSGSPTIQYLCLARGIPGCTLGAILSQQGKPISSGVASLVSGYQTFDQQYSSIIGQDTSVSGVEIGLNLAVNTFAPGNTVNSILGEPNDTIVPSANQAVEAEQCATVNGVVHTFPLFNDVNETGSSVVWAQATHWLLGGIGLAPTSEVSQCISASATPSGITRSATSTDVPTPVLDLTGYTQVPASNVSFSPDPSAPLTTNMTASITATSSSKTLSEVLLFQAVSDPADTPIYAVTTSPFTISFTPTRLGTANFTAFAVFTDKTFATVPLNYSLQPPGSALALTLAPPPAGLPVGLSSTVDAQALYSSGPVDVTASVTYSARSGGTQVFSVGANGSITTTGDGTDWLNASYGGVTASTPISVGSCVYSLGPSNQLIEQSGGSVTIQVNTQDGCFWTLDSGGATWLSLSNVTGTGSGTVSAAAGPNASGATQTAIITLGDSDVALTQPATACTYGLATSGISAPSSGSNGSIAVTTTCTIPAYASQPWINVTVSSGVVYYSIAANTGSSRSATITIGDQSVTVMQAGTGGGTAASVSVASGSGQTAVYGSVFSSPLAVLVSDSNGNPVTGATVMFSGTGVSFSASSAVTSTNGQASILATATQVGSLSVMATTSGVSNGATFSLTGTPAVLTVTASNASRVFGATNPTFTYMVTGFVNGDNSSVVSGTATETTSATGTSGVGTYPITFSSESLTATNYTFSYVNGVLSVTPTTQTITFNPLPNVTYGVAPILLGASASSALPISYAVSGPATISGSSLTVTGVGMVVVTASQAGNADYSAATPVSQSFSVGMASQTITFNPIAGQAAGTSLTLTATSSSGLPVLFTSLTPGVCTVAGTVATLVTAGTCTIQASQAGNSDYKSATQVSQSFTVSSGANFTIKPIPPAETIKRGVLGAFILELKSIDHFNGEVKLSCEGGPKGSKCSDFPMIVRVDGTAFAFSGILFPEGTVPGSYTITFVGTSGTLTNTATAEFTVK